MIPESKWTKQGALSENYSWGMFFHGLGEGGIFYFLRWSNSFQTIAELLIDGAGAKFKAASSFTKL